MTHQKKVHMIVDMQYGSTGKGLLAGYLGETLKPDLVMSANMPNAGHTYINKDGRVWMHKVLPNSIVSPNLTHVLIGPGAVFSYDQLLSEMYHSADLLNGVEILIHPNATVLRESHRLAEDTKGMVESIGSTAQGSAAAMIDKIMRDPNKKVIARDVLGHQPFSVVGMDTACVAEAHVCDHDEYCDAISMANLIIAEGAQGYSLGLNQEFYPYCTSRECTPSRFMSDMALPLPMLAKTYGSLRTYPIRVAGNSGPHYSDQVELSWKDLGVEPELTTVTKKVRRVFTFSYKQLADAAWEIAPDVIFLNFANYLENQEAFDMAERIQDATGVKKVLMGWGPKFDDVEVAILAHEAEDLGAEDETVG